MPAGKMMLVTQGKLEKKKKRKRNPNHIPKLGFRPSIQGNASGQPRTKRVTLRYATAISITSSVGAINNYNFSANNARDPDISGGGHSAMTYDQLELMYNHVVVESSKIKCTFKNISSDTQFEPAFLSIQLSDDGVLDYANFHGYLENAKGYYTFDAGQHAGNSNKLKVLTSTFVAKKFFNITDIKDNADRIGHLTSSNTANDTAYYQILVGAQGTSTQIYRVFVEVAYTCIFSEPKNMIQS